MKPVKLTKTENLDHIAAAHNSFGDTPAILAREAATALVECAVTSDLGRFTPNCL